MIERKNYHKKNMSALETSSAFPAGSEGHLLAYNPWWGTNCSYLEKQRSYLLEKGSVIPQGDGVRS